jgi:hypothetical protein
MHHGHGIYFQGWRENRNRFSGAAARIEASRRKQEADWNEVSFGKAGRNSLNQGERQVIMHAQL